MYDTYLLLLLLYFHAGLWYRFSVAVLLFLVSHFHFLFIPCGRLGWLPVSFLLHVKYTLSYRMILVRVSLA